MIGSVGGTGSITVSGVHRFWPPRAGVRRPPWWQGFARLDTILLFSGSSRRTTTKRYYHLNLLGNLGQQIPLPGVCANRTAGFTKIRVSKVQNCHLLSSSNLTICSYAHGWTVSLGQGGATSVAKPIIVQKLARNLRPWPRFASPQSRMTRRSAIVWWHFRLDLASPRNTRTLTSILLPCKPSALPDSGETEHCV